MAFDYLLSYYVQLAREKVIRETKMPSRVKCKQCGRFMSIGEQSCLTPICNKCYFDYLESGQPLPKESTGAVLGLQGLSGLQRLPEPESEKKAKVTIWGNGLAKTVLTYFMFFVILLLLAGIVAIGFFIR